VVGKNGRGGLVFILGIIRPHQKDVGGRKPENKIKGHQFGKGGFGGEENFTGTRGARVRAKRLAEGVREKVIDWGTY